MALVIEDLLSVAGLSVRDAAAKLGVGKTTISKYRNIFKDALGAPVAKPNALPGYSFQQTPDGTIVASTKPSEAPQTLEDAYRLLTAKDVDISSHDVTYGFREQELASGKVTHQYTIRAVPKKPGASEVVKLNADELIESIKGFTFVPSPKAVNPQSFVITPSDMQIGKTSFNGGTAETVERVMGSFARAAEFCKEFNPAEIVIAELGDPLENFYSTSSQRETNDLDITGQIRVVRRLLLDGIKQLSPYSPVVRYAAVPSNHGSVRVGFKAPAGDNHNDWGLEIADQLADALAENPSMGHVTFHKPAHLYESLMLETSGTKLGLVHGHQSKGADKLGEWWKGQDHGRQPTWNADILLAGHWHSLRVFQSGDGRWVMVSPAQDPGSDWFTNITGEYSETGMLSFTTHDGKWDNFKVL